ncbi:hypothetical protein KSF78_0004438 [Schistosoma japonicum]|nr:hypothetical protein KSF78_0004438 [Schistosoma japonicum]
MALRLANSEMRIINLVNISTVLLLINLLQTKSQGNGEQHETGFLAFMTGFLKRIVSTTSRKGCLQR